MTKKRKAARAKTRTCPECGTQFEIHIARGTRSRCPCCARSLDVPIDVVPYAPMEARRWAAELIEDTIGRLARPAPTAELQLAKEELLLDIGARATAQWTHDTPSRTGWYFVRAKETDVAVPHRFRFAAGGGKWLHSPIDGEGKRWTGKLWRWSVPISEPPR